MSPLIAALLGAAAGLLGPFFVWLNGRRKNDVDESAMILGKWKELVDTHEASIKRLTDEFERQRKIWREDTERLTSRITELETEGRAKDAKIKGLEDEVAGLKRAIAQNSQSTAHLLGSQSRSNTNAFPEVLE